MTGYIPFWYMFEGRAQVIISPNLLNDTDVHTQVVISALMNFINFL